MSTMALSIMGVRPFMPYMMPWPPTAVWAHPSHATVMSKDYTITMAQQLALDTAFEHRTWNRRERRAQRARNHDRRFN